MKFWDIGWKILLVVGVGLNLYLTQNFVTKREYVADMTQNAKDHLTIQTSIADIATTLKIMAAAQARLEDHEARIRLVETRQIDVLSRLLTVERNQDKIMSRIP
jgi:phage baseplate assembly protein W